MTHISLDLETMGTGPMSSILSIGAVVFELDGTYTNLSGPAFYTTIDLKSCEDHGLRIDASAVKWWATQSEAARRVITDPDALLLAHALHQFASFVTDQAEPRIWCRGPDFDGVILNQAYKACSMKTPWKYSALRCVRTICDLANLDVNTVPRIGPAHSALDDAFHQARCIQEAWRRLMT